MFYFWPFGLGLYLMNAIFVDRGNPKVAHELLLTKSRNVLQNKVLFKTIFDTLWYLRKVIIKSQNICITR